MTTTNLVGKSIIVTGSGQGLGRAYSLALAAAGAAVIVNDISGASAEAVVGEIRETGGRAGASGHSVTDPDAAEELVALAVSEFGRLDGIVNNAGVLYEAPAWEMSAQQVKRLVDVNVLGTMYCGHAAIRRLRAQGTGGSIINVTSGTHLGQPGLAIYGATKGAIASLTYGWALDVHGSGIRVNAISPLAVTAMKLPPYDGHAMPADIAALVCYLLSDASSGITGQLVRRARTGLGIMRHPAIGTMLDGDWGVEQIAAAFDEVLVNELEPIGFGGHRIDLATR